MRTWEELSLALAEFSAHLGRAPDETVLQQRYVDGVQRFMPGLGAGIYLLNPNGGQMRDVAARGVSDYFLARYEEAGRARDPVLQSAVSTKSTAYNGELTSIQAWKATAFYQEVLALHRIDHSLEAPIVLQGQVVGTLNFGRREDQGGYDARERSLADTLGRVVGTALLSVRERQGAVRRCERLQAALDLVAQPIVITDLTSAERISNPAAQAVLRRLKEAQTSLDELMMRPGRAEGDVAGHEMPIPVEGGTATVRSRTVRPADGIEVSFLDLVRRGEPVRGSLVEPLTPREREVAQLAANGLTDREIAERLFLSPHTVKGYMKACYRKLGVNSRVALARLGDL